MSDIEQQAFPDGLLNEYGMSLRDYFAAQAMQGLISSHWCEEARVLSPKLGALELAEDAYIMADAMLKAGGV
jgi:hypothetical protein